MNVLSFMAKTYMYPTDPKVVEAVALLKSRGLIPEEFDPSYMALIYSRKTKNFRIKVDENGVPVIREGVKR